MEFKLRVVTPEEMTRIDQAAIREEKIPSLKLMERAGECAAAVARDMLSSSGGPKGGRVAIWCGRGNNGGDGFVVARLLYKSGIEVDTFMIGPASGISEDAAVNLESLKALPVSVVEVAEKRDLDGFVNAMPTYDLIVDAVFGTGFSGKAEGIFRDAIEEMNRAGSPVLAIDIPSGVSGETGAAIGPAVRAARTVTFGLPKVGLVQFPGAELAGEWEVADIGIPPHLMESVPSSRVFLITEALFETLMPVRSQDVHKGRCGRVLVIGGSPGLSGAAALCARSALRSGAGLVTLAVPEVLHRIMEIKLTEVMTRPLPETAAGTLSLKGAGMIAELSNEFDVIALGPGISTQDETAQLVRELIPNIEIPLVLDADGLNAVEGHTDLLKKRERPVAITPHPGEMARLIKTSVAEVQGDRVRVACRGANQWGAVVVLKGAGTVVADPGGEVRVNTTGNPGMASAGTGDVLTGCIAALIGQGLSVFDASVTGVYLHGYAADLAASMDGMVGMVAGDIVRHLPLAMRRRD